MRCGSVWRSRTRAPGARRNAVTRPSLPCTTSTFPIGATHSAGSDWGCLSECSISHTSDDSRRRLLLAHCPNLVCDASKVNADGCVLMAYSLSTCGGGLAHTPVPITRGHAWPCLAMLGHARSTASRDAFHSRREEGRPLHQQVCLRPGDDTT